MSHQIIDNLHEVFFHIVDLLENTEYRKVEANIKIAHKYYNVIAYKIKAQPNLIRIDLNKKEEK